MKHVIFLTFLIFTFPFYSQKKQDILHARFDLAIYPVEKKISGVVQYELKAHENQIVLDAHEKIRIKKILLNGRKTDFKHKNNHLFIRTKNKEKKHHLEIFFETIEPEQAIYFVGWGNKNKNQVWTQGQGKKHSHWIPITDDMNDKFTWHLHLHIPDGYEGISNGILLKEKSGRKTRKTYIYEMNKPVSSYLFFVGVGKYEKEEKNFGPVKYTAYKYPDARPVDVTFSKSKDIFQTLTQKIPYPYPWKTYREIPIRDFFYGGMENVCASTFHDLYYVNDTAWNDINPVNILAHELAHQWFGNLVTETSPRNHWIHEGFATFYALETEREIFGQDYTDFKYLRLKKSIFQALENGDTIPLHNGKASSVTFYYKGAWVIKMLRDRLSGPVFNQVIHKFLEKYRYQNVSTEDFQGVLFEITRDSLNDFFHYWFDQIKIPEISVSRQNDTLVFRSTDTFSIPLRIYYKNGSYSDIKTNRNFIIPNFQNYAFFIPDPDNKTLSKIHWELNQNEILYALRFNLSSYNMWRIVKQLKHLPQELHTKILLDLSSQNLFYKIHEQVILQSNHLPDSVRIPILKNIFKHGLKNRQMLAKHVRKIPTELQSRFENLLNDPSYETISYAFFHLIRNFPSETKRYLEKTKHIIGFNHHDFRMLWLEQALRHADNTVEIKKYRTEIIRYASPDFDAYTRHNALAYIDAFEWITPETIEYIKTAAEYFHPQLRKLARKMKKKYGID